ncbi:hypothetical protein GG344DRAFT_70723 [Lentinula edodes]|nr:hypothetical protein GG344DRAFT_70723 [Lentinula edodes]
MHTHFATLIEFEDIHSTTHVVLPLLTPTAISFKTQELRDYSIEVVHPDTTDRAPSQKTFIQPLNIVVREDGPFQPSNQTLSHPLYQQHSGNAPQSLHSVTHKAGPHAPPNQQPNGNLPGSSSAKFLDTYVHIPVATSKEGDFRQKGFEVQREPRCSVTNNRTTISTIVSKAWKGNNLYIPVALGTTLANPQKTVIGQDNRKKNIQVKSEPQSISSAIRFRRQVCCRSPYQTCSKSPLNASAGQDSNINIKSIRNDQRKHSFESREWTLNITSDPSTFGYASLEYHEDKVRLKDVTTSGYTYHSSSPLKRPPDLPANHVGLKHNDIFLHIHEAQPTKFLSCQGQLIISRLLEGVPMWIWNQALSEWEKICYGEKRIISQGDPPYVGHPKINEKDIIDITSYHLNADLGTAQNAWNEAAEQRSEAMSLVCHSTEEERRVLTQLAIDTEYSPYFLTTYTRDWEFKRAFPPKGRLKESIIPNSMFKAHCQEALRTFAAIINIDPLLQRPTLPLLPTAQCYPGPDTTVAYSSLFRVDTSPPRECQTHGIGQNHPDIDQNCTSVPLDEFLQLVLDVVDDFRADGQRIVKQVLEANERLQSCRESHQEHLDLLNDYTDNMVDRLELKLKLLQEKHSNHTNAGVSLECGPVHTTEYLGNLWEIALQFLTSQGPMNTGNKVLNELYHLSDSIAPHSENFEMHSSFMERLQFLVLQSQYQPIFVTTAENVLVKDCPTNEAIFQSCPNAVRNHKVVVCLDDTVYNTLELHDDSAIKPSASLRPLAEEIASVNQDYVVPKLSHTIEDRNHLQGCTDAALFIASSPTARSISATFWMSVSLTGTKTGSVQVQNPQIPIQTALVPDTSQLELYNTTAVLDLEPLLTFCTPTTFVYGPTSSGETHGIAALLAGPRIIPQSIRVFLQMGDAGRERAKNLNYEDHFSYFDSYQDDIFDLRLFPQRGHDELPIKTNAKGEMLVVVLTKVGARFETSDDWKNVSWSASQNQTTFATLFNRTLSRSYETSSIKWALIVEHTSKTRNMSNVSIFAISSWILVYNGEIYNSIDLTKFENNMSLIPYGDTSLVTSLGGEDVGKTISTYTDVKFRSDVLDSLKYRTAIEFLSLMGRTLIQGQRVLVTHIPAPGSRIPPYGDGIQWRTTHVNVKSSDDEKRVEVEVNTELLIVEVMNNNKYSFGVSSGVTSPSSMKFDFLAMFSAFSKPGTSQSHLLMTPMGPPNPLDDAEPAAPQQRSKVLMEVTSTLMACLYSRSLWGSFSFETDFLPSASNKMLPWIRSCLSLSKIVYPRIDREGTPPANHCPVINLMWNTFKDLTVVCRKEVVYAWNTFKHIWEDFLTLGICLSETVYLWIALTSNLSMELIVLVTDRLMAHCLIHSTQQPRTWAITEVLGLGYTETIYRCAHVPMACLVWMWQEYHHITMTEPQFSIIGLALSMDSRYLAVPYGICVDIYDLESNVNNPLAQYSGPNERKVSFIAWSSELPRLVMSFEGGSMYIVTMNEQSSTIAGFHHSGRHERAKVPAWRYESVLMTMIIVLIGNSCKHLHNPSKKESPLQLVIYSQYMYLDTGSCLHMKMGLRIIWNFHQSQSPELTIRYEDMILLPGIMSRNDVCSRRGTILVTAPGTYQVFSIESKTAQNIFIPRDPLERTPQAVTSARFLSDDLILGVGVGQLVLWNADLGNRLQNLVFRNQDTAVTASHICLAYNAVEDIGWIVAAQGSEVTFWKTIYCLGGETSADRAGNSCLQDGVAGSGDSKENHKSQYVNNICHRHLPDHNSLISPHMTEARKDMTVEGIASDLSHTRKKTLRILLKSGVVVYVRVMLGFDQDFI